MVMKAQFLAPLVALPFETKVTRLNSTAFNCALDVSSFDYDC